MIDVEPFCGSGGASLGLTRAGLHPIGIDHWHIACATHHAAGHSTIRADLATYPWRHLYGKIRFMWASPPCQPFSATGDQLGECDNRNGIPWWLRAVDECRPLVLVMENVRGLTFDKHADYLGQMIATLRGFGYEVGWRILNAADYGVPQTRERFILIGRRDGGPIAWPTVTHTEQRGLFTQCWVTMADALGWNEDDATIRSWKRILHTNRGQDDNGNHQTVDPHQLPAPALTGKAVGQSSLQPGAPKNRARRANLAPALPIAFGNDAPSWYWERPATTVVGDPRIMAPGHHDPDRSGSQMADAVRVEIWEAAVLQGFPPDYPFQGSHTVQAQQIGNAVPPPLAEAIARALNLATMPQTTPRRTGNP